MDTAQLIFVIASGAAAVALIVAVWKLGNSVPAWLLEALQAGGALGAGWAKGTENKIDDEIWEEILNRIDQLEVRIDELPVPPTESVENPESNAPTT